MQTGTLQCRQDCDGGMQCAEVHTEQHPSVRIHGGFQDNLLIQERRVHVSQMSGGGKQGWGWWVMEVFYSEGFSCLQMTDVTGTLNGLTRCLILVGTWMGSQRSSYWMEK